MEDKPLVTPLDPQTLSPNKPVIQAPGTNQTAGFFLFMIVILGGLVFGYFLSRGSTAGTKVTTAASGGKNVVNTAQEVGSADTETFKDNATGVLQEGGIKNEGTHKLIRDGGPTKTVYLVSSVVDLEPYVGKKVQVWGQTLKAKYAGWLMDVGRLKILE